MTDDIMLFRQNQKLQEENKKLRKLLGLSETEEIEKNRYVEQSLFNKSPSEDKVRLFMSLFKGRSDVFAMRWESKSGKSGYSPCCVNEWIAGLCKKPKIK
ncbi:MAG TPA: helicase, partial [bacterium]|nr:helicase [bacterium]